MSGITEEEREWIERAAPYGTLSSVGPYASALLPNEPGPISFHANGEMLFMLKPDGTIERGPAYRSDDQASVAFLDCLAGFAPSFIAGLRNRIVELEQENARLKTNCST